MITEAEEAALVASLEKLELKPFEFHRHLGNRLVISFGFRYDYGQRTVEKASDSPSSLQELRGKVAEFDEQTYTHSSLLIAWTAQTPRMPVIPTGSILEIDGSTLHILRAVLSRIALRALMVAIAIETYFREGLKMKCVTMLYPNQQGASFNFDYYYLNRHIPWARQLVPGSGIEILRGVSVPTEGPVSYFWLCRFSIDLEEDHRAAMAKHGSELMADFMNFTNIKPIVRIDEVLLEHRSQGRSLNQRSRRTQTCRGIGG